jgi:mRNA interferase RelE/StbE
LPAWKVEFEKNAAKELNRLDNQHVKRILRFLFDKIATPDDPRRFGEPLKHNLSGLWKYRVGEHRIICDIHNNTITIFVVRIGHRKNVYKKK